METISTKGFEAVVRNNLTGGYIFMREVYNRSMAAHGGAIVNIIADIWNGWPEFGHSAAARGGMLDGDRRLRMGDGGRACQRGRARRHCVEWLRYLSTRRASQDPGVSAHGSAAALRYGIRDIRGHRLFAVSGCGLCHRRLFARWRSAQRAARMAAGDGSAQPRL
jgi:hypothetical protein